jgi:hypothetical protein
MRHLRCMFNYDYRQIDLMILRAAGIRRFREVEEMIEGDSFAEEIPGPGSFYCFTGFTSESKPLKVTIKSIVDKDMDVDIEVREVRKPTVEEIIDNFCRHCHSRNYPKY